MAKPALPRLSTPKNATFPSEISGSPVSGVIQSIKQEEGLTTPITPPVAYTDFLKALTPVLASPISAGVFTFTELPSGKSTPVSEPSTASFTSTSSDGIKSPATSVAPTPTSAAPSSASFAYPARKMSKHSLRRLRIPASSPTSSPSCETPSSIATSARSQFSPADWMSESPRSATVRPVCVRSVVTRTVTYKRTPLEPPPKGKKRKIEEEDSISSGGSLSGSVSGSVSDSVHTPSGTNTPTPTAA